MGHRWRVLVQDDFDKSATRLSNALTGACVRALRRQDVICVAASGGLDSSVLAALLSRHGDIPVQLITVGAAGAADPLRARELARHLGQPLLELVLTPKRVEGLLPELVPLVGLSKVDAELAHEWGVSPESEFVSPLRTSWELPIFAAAQEARRFGRRLVLGQGADEWLLGYTKYQDVDAATASAVAERDRATLETDVMPLEARIAKRFDLDFQYPYLNPVVRSACASMPASHLIHGGERKRVLREVARRLDLPESVAQVPKTAAQYGSGVAEILRDLAASRGQHQNEFLTDFLQRRTGELHSLRT